MYVSRQRCRMVRTTYKYRVLQKKQVRHSQTVQSYGSDTVVTQVLTPAVFLFGSQLGLFLLCRI